MYDSLTNEAEEIRLEPEIAAENADEAEEEDFLDEVDESGEGEPRQAWQPDVSHLNDAVQDVGGVPTLIIGKGDRIVVDNSRTRIGASLDTRLWQIDTIKDDGFLGLWDPWLHQFGCTNWKQAAEKGQLLKVPGLKDDWSPRKSAVSRKKSAKRDMVKAMMDEKKAQTTSESTEEPKRGRGRPKGSINKLTRERLESKGLDPDKMTRAEIDEVINQIRAAEYEAKKAENKVKRETAKEKAR